MLADLVKSPTTCRRLLEFLKEAQVEPFVQSLIAGGYSPVTVAQTCHFLTTLMSWMASNGFGADVVIGLEAYGARAMRGRVASSSDTVRRARRAGKQYLRFLRRQAIVPEARARRQLHPSIELRRSREMTRLCSREMTPSSCRVGS